VRLRTVPVTFAQAREFVSDWHRHHRPPVGHKYSLGVADDRDVLVGVAVVGRPVARHLDDGLTLPAPTDIRICAMPVRSPTRLAGVTVQRDRRGVGCHQNRWHPTPRRYQRCVIHQTIAPTAAEPAAAAAPRIPANMAVRPSRLMT